MKILAIDLGTQSIKAAIVNLDGNIHAKNQIAQEIISPQPGWAEQQPQLWWNLTQQVIKDVIKKARIDASVIKGVSCCGQMHGPVGISKNGKITTERTQIWMDKRSNEICELIRKNFNESELAQITGNPVTTGWPGVKVRWIKDHQPEVYDKTEYFLVPKDFINYKLTGVIATDPSEASGTYLYDIHRDEYSQYMSEVLEVDLNKFAPIYNSYDTIGTIKEDISSNLGISKDIPVITGGGDFIVSLLGLGLIDDSTAIDMTGTSTLFVVHKDKPIIHPAVQNLRHVIKGWTPFTMLDCGGLSMKWCLEMLNSISEGEISYEKMIQMAENVPVGSDGLLFYPYMLGERRKENVMARGCFFGLNLNHDASHISRSVMEGVALALGKDVQIFRNLDVNFSRVFCVGGATRNKFLYRIKANVIKVPQILTTEPEASLRGNALLAAYGLGLIDDLKEVIKPDKHENVIIKPDLEETKKYETLLENFIKMYDHMLGYWKKS